MRLLDESSEFVLPGTAEAIRPDLGLTFTDISWAFVMIGIGALAGTPITVAADRCSRRLVCAGGAALGAIALLLLAAATSFTAVVVATFLLGVSSTAMVDVGEIALADVVGDDLERHLTTQNVLASAGDVLGPVVVVGVVASGGSWRWSFVVVAILVGAYAVWLATLPFPAPAPVVPDEDAGVRAVLGDVVRDPAVWLAGAVAALLNPLDEPLLGFLVAHLEHARDLDRAAATVVASMSVVGGFVGYASLRARRAHLAVDATMLALATTGCLVAPGTLSASIASTAVGVFLVRVWIDVQRRTLTLRPGQSGAVKAVTGVIETASLALPLAAGIAADALGAAGGLAAFAVMAWALAWAGVALHARGRAGSNPD